MHPPDNEQALITRLLDLPRGDQEAALREACTATPDLRDREPAIRAALDAHRPSQNRPPAGSAMNNREVAQVLALALDAPADEAPGSRVGAYKLLQELGQGGFGVVWMAEQSEPIRRRVALKIIKQGMDTREVIARFETERQALAMMDHPNIAHVLDAGATASGRPYFAMELVRGVPITRYCNEQRLSIEQRLGLFTRVCHAVQHAHQKGVIHRDLKPSNILVTLHDGVPVPKIIDFGIAKATSGALTDKTLFTEFHAFIGTPAYTSPEQMEMSGLDVDTRSDIYSLGVLLYELLTGIPPFDPEELRKSGLEAMRATIREKDPVRPSQRLRTLDVEALTTTAKQRCLEPARLAPALSGDLDWIAMHCLEKDRTRRYATASGLAADIDRFLAHEPVTARPPSTAYRVAKYVRRHRLGVGAGAIVVLALVAGTCVSILALVRESAARQREAALRVEAQESASLARAAAAHSERVVEFLKEILGSVSPSTGAASSTDTREAILASAAARIDAELSDQPEFAADLRMTLGSVFRELGTYGSAELILNQSIETFRASGPAHRASLATALCQLGMVRVLANHPDDARAPLKESLALRESLYGRRHPATAEALYHLSCTGLSLKESIPMREEVLDIRRATLPPDDPAIAGAIFGLASQTFGAGNLTRSIALHREALELRRRALGPTHPEVAQSLHSMSLCLINLGEIEQARTALREALVIRRKTLGDAHPQVVSSLLRLTGTLPARTIDVGLLDATREIITAQRAELPNSAPGLAAALLVLASSVEFQSGQSAAAVRMETEARELIATAQANNVAFDMHVPSDMQVFVVSKLRAAVPEEGRRMAETLLVMMEHSGEAAMRGSTLSLKFQLGIIDLCAGRYDAASDRFGMLCEPGPVPPRSRSFQRATLHAVRAESLRRAGHPDEAWAAITAYTGGDAGSASPAIAGLGPESSPALLELGVQALAHGDNALALSALRQACAHLAGPPLQKPIVMELAYPDDRYTSTLGVILARMGHAEEAGITAQAAARSLKDRMALGHQPPAFVVAEIRANLAETFSRVGNPEQAEAWRTSPTSGDDFGDPDYDP